MKHSHPTAEQVRHERGTILLLCGGCDMERNAPAAFCPACEERTISYEYIVGFDYAMARATNEILRDGVLNAIVPPSLSLPFLNIAGTGFHNGRVGG